MLAIAASNLTLFDIPALAAIVLIWVRLEHRLTRIETQLENLPCKSDKDLCNPAD